MLPQNSVQNEIKPSVLATISGYAIRFNEPTSMVGFEGKSPSNLDLKGMNPSNLYSLPMFLEHDESFVFGQWLNFEADNIGLRATGVLFKSAFTYLDYVFEKVVAKATHGLSFGGYGTVEDGVMTIADITEVSIVQKPAIRGSMIDTIKLEPAGEKLLSRGVE